MRKHTDYTSLLIHANGFLTVKKYYSAHGFLSVLPSKKSSVRLPLICNISLWLFYLRAIEVSVSEAVFIHYIHYCALTPDILLLSWGLLLFFPWKCKGTWKALIPFFSWCRSVMIHWITEDTANFQVICGIATVSCRIYDFCAQHKPMDTLVPLLVMEPGGCNAAVTHHNTTWLPQSRVPVLRAGVLSALPKFFFFSLKRNKIEVTRDCANLIVLLFLTSKPKKKQKKTTNNIITKKHKKALF